MKKRVLIVTNSLTGGGAERSMNLVCNELSRRGWPVALVPINSSGPDQINPICEVFPLERKWKGGLMQTFSAIWKFNRVVRSWNPDLVILNCDLPELFGVFLFSRQRFVAVEHIGRPWATRVPLGRIVRELLSLRKVTWVAVSEHLTIWPSNQTPKAILLNSIAPYVQLPSEKSSSVMNANLNRLIFIGRLVPQKRPEWLLDIGARTGFPLNIIGEGYMRDALQNEALERKIKAKFLGQIREPWSTLEEGDLLIVPSEFEGDGLVVIEGMQQGLPMLLADTPDFRRFGFPDRNYCKDVASFVDKIDSYRDNLTALKITWEVADKILSSRSLLAVGNSWESFLNSI